MLDLRVLVSTTLLICIVLLYTSFPTSAQTKIGVGSEFLGEVPQLIGTIRFGILGARLGLGKIKSAVTFSSDGRFYFSLGKFIPFNLYIGAGIVIVKPPAHSFIGYNLMSGVEVELYSFGLRLIPFAGLNYMNFAKVENKRIKGLGTHIGVLLEF